MEEWRFKFDGTTVPGPKEWRKAGLAVKYDTATFGYYVEFEETMTWAKGAFTILFGLFEASPCAKVIVNFDFRAHPKDAFSTKFTGAILLKDCIFNFNNCTVKAKVIDSSGAALIRTNAKIKTRMDEGFSKNEETITTPTNRNIDFFRPSTGLNSNNNVEAYTVGDALTFLVKFCSDDQMQFASTTFGTGGDLEGDMLTTGAAIGDPGNTGYAPYTSLFEVLENLHKAYNIITWTDPTTSPPTFRVEPQTVARASAYGFNYQNLRNLTAEVQSESLYAKVKTGSTTTQQSQGGTYTFPDIVYLSTKEEEFHFFGNCNTDTELDLLMTYVIDSNVIEDIIDNGVATYDNNVFLVETDYPATNDTTKYDIFAAGGATRVYNLGLTTKYRLESGYWEGYLPNGLAQFLGDGNDQFRAQMTSALAASGGNIFLQKLAIDDDSTGSNSDPNGNYNTSTYRYTAPNAGLYGFKADIRVNNIALGGIGNTVDCTIYIRHYDSAATLKSALSVTYALSNGSTNTVFQPNSYYADANDYFEVWFKGQASFAVPPESTYEVATSSYWQSVITESGGGQYAEFDPQDYAIKLWKWKNRLCQADQLSIINNPISILTFSPLTLPDGRRDGFVESVTLFLATNVADFVMKTGRKP